jgi:hypothetical protein
MRGVPSNEDRAMLFNEDRERRRRVAADLFNKIVCACANPVLMVDRDLPEMLIQEVIPYFLLGRPLRLRRRSPR